MHYYKFNIPDWNLGTSHLDLVEEAVYFRLINFYYDTEKPIPLETQSVFRKLRMGSESVIGQQILDEFFTKTDKGYVHGRCEKDLKEFRKTAKKNKENGAKGGRPRKTKVCEQTQEKPSGLPDESQKNPNHKPITNNHKPITNKDIKATWKPPEGLNMKAWNDFELHRKEIKKPLTDKARTLAANSIKNLSQIDQQQTVDRSIQSRWSGLFPDKQKQGAANTHNLSSIDYGESGAF